MNSPIHSKRLPCGSPAGISSVSAHCAFGSAKKPAIAEHLPLLCPPRFARGGFFHA